MNGKHLLIAFMALLVLAGIVAASEPMNGSVTAGNQSRYQQPAAVAGSLVTEGGNVTEVNISGTNSSTERWAGFYGNLSGSNLVLGDSTGNEFYAWSVGNVNELWKVYASEDSNPTWASLVAGGCSGNCNTWVYNGAWADNYTNTFTSSGAARFADITIANINYTLSFNYPGDPTWPTYDLSDGTGEDIWAANISTSASAFNNQSGVVYQLLVPANPNPDTSVTYYFYLEVN